VQSSFLSLADLRPQQSLSLGLQNTVFLPAEYGGRQGSCQDYIDVPLREKIKFKGLWFKIL